MTVIHVCFRSRGPTLCDLILCCQASSQSLWCHHRLYDIASRAGGIEQGQGIVTTKKGDELFHVVKERDLTGQEGPVFVQVCTCITKSQYISDRAGTEFIDSVHAESRGIHGHGYKRSQKLPYTACMN